MANLKISIGNPVNVLFGSSNTDKVSYVYKDFNPQMIVNEAGDDISALYDINTIKSSLNNLFTYNKYERILNPEYCLDLKRFLYEPLNGNVLSGIGMEITNAINLWEPRISVKDINVIPKYDDNTFEIEITYTCNNLRNKQFTYKHKVTNF
jgi:phage baseplate assembly protein W